MQIVSCPKNKQMTQYRILSHLNFHVFSEKKSISCIDLVNYALTAGCKLQGGVSVSQIDFSPMKYQAILGTEDQLKKLNSIVESKINPFYKELIDDIDKKEKEVVKLNTDEIKESKERIKSEVPEEEAKEIESKVKDLERIIRKLEDEQKSELAKCRIPSVTDRFQEISKEMRKCRESKNELQSLVSLKRYDEGMILSSEAAIKKITAQSDKERKEIQKQNSLSLKNAYI